MAKRKPIPDRIKLAVALRRFGLSVADVNFDHNPALGLRPYNHATGDTIPPANDPNFIDMLLTETEHKPKTFGPGGEKRITTAGSDIHRIRKVDRLSAQQQEFRRRITAQQSCNTPEPDRGKKRTASIPSRPFQKRKKDRGNEQQD